MSEKKFDKVKYNNAFIAKSYDRINLTILKGKKSVISEIAAAQGESINGYTKKALKAQIKADTGEDVEL